MRRLTYGFGVHGRMEFDCSPPPRPPFPQEKAIDKTTLAEQPKISFMYRHRPLHPLEQESPPDKGILYGTYCRHTGWPCHLRWTITHNDHEIGAVFKQKSRYIVGSGFVPVVQISFPSFRSQTLSGAWYLGMYATHIVVRILHLVEFHAPAQQIIIRLSLFCLLRGAYECSSTHIDGLRRRCLRRRWTG